MSSVDSRPTDSTKRATPKRGLSSSNDEIEDVAIPSKVSKPSSHINDSSEIPPGSPDSFEMEKIKDQDTQTSEEYITDIEKILKNYHDNYKELELEEYKQMLQKFYTQNLRLATRCQKLKAIIEKNTSTTTRILREASKQVNPHQLAFISAQLINNGKPPKKRVWSPQMKSIMIGLIQVSPAAYNFLSKVLLLPEEEEVRQWMNTGMDCELLDEEAKKQSSDDSSLCIESQAVIDEITFENLMATLL